MTGAADPAMEGAGTDPRRLFLVLSPVKSGGVRHAIGDVVAFGGDVTAAAIDRLVARGTVAEVDPASIDEAEGASPNTGALAGPDPAVGEVPAGPGNAPSDTAGDGQGPGGGTSDQAAATSTAAPPAAVETASTPARKGGKTMKAVP